MAPGQGRSAAENWLHDGWNRSFSLRSTVLSGSELAFILPHEYCNSQEKRMMTLAPNVVFRAKPWFVPHCRYRLLAADKAPASLDKRS
jgi:hypothetical protein